MYDNDQSRLTLIIDSFIIDHQFFAIFGDDASDTKNINILGGERVSCHQTNFQPFLAEYCEGNQFVQR